MKKNIIIATIAVASTFILSVSCQKQEILVSENTNDSEIAAFTATIDQELTKTVLVAGSASGKFMVNWVAEDKISIKGAEYTVTEIKDGGAKATFSGTGASKEGGKYKAIYPSTFHKPGSFGSYYFELPSIQTYAAGKFNAPMYAESETESLAFKNICGVLCLSLKGDSNDKVRYITVIADEGVCGKFTMGSDATTLTLSGTAGEYSRTVSLDCGEGGVELNNTTPTNFYIYLPPNTYAAGMKIIITTADSKVFEKITTASATIERNNIYTFNDWTLNFQAKPALLSGEFTVAGDKTVKFTKGNLWADAFGDNASNPVLHFETNQYGFDKTYSDMSHVSYFNCSSTVGKAVGTMEEGAFLFCDENHKQPVDGQSDCYALSNGEWSYLFTSRTSAANKYGYATVNDVCGIIILPDTFDDPYAGIKAFKPKSKTSYSANKYSEAEWIAMEAGGAVFLPAAGYREGSSVNSANGYGYYWSSTPDEYTAYFLYFHSSAVNFNSGYSRDLGHSVRLVKNNLE